MVDPFQVSALIWQYFSSFLGKSFRNYQVLFSQIFYLFALPCMYRHTVGSRMI